MNKYNDIFYCDMDGVLADFNSEKNALERFKTEKGFFKNLKPINENVKALKEIMKNGYDVRILSTSPNAQADKDKRKWLKEHLPEIARHKIIFGRPEIAKIKYVSERNKKRAVLFDDYGKNVAEWVDGGGLHAIKITPNPKNAEIDYLSLKYVARVLESIL